MWELDDFSGFGYFLRLGLSGFGELVLDFINKRENMVRLSSNVFGVFWIGFVKIF